MFSPPRAASVGGAPSPKPLNVGAGACACGPLPVEECVSKSVQLPERLLGVDDQSVAGYDPLCVPVHHCDEGIRGGLGANPHAREVLLQQVAETGWKKTDTKMNK